MDKKQTIIQSSLGSVFSIFSEEELEKTTNSEENKIAISGKINNPGIIEVQKGSTLVDIINLSLIHI